MQTSPKREKFPFHCLKLNTPELRQEAFISYCAHLSKGLAKNSWVFESGDIKNVTCQQIDNAIRQFGDEFDTDALKAAYAKNFAYWEQIMIDVCLGKRQTNSAILMMVMRNRFGYDKIDYKGELGDEVENSYRALMHQIQKRQVENQSIDDAIVDK